MQNLQIENNAWLLGIKAAEHLFRCSSEETISLSVRRAAHEMPQL